MTYSSARKILTDARASGAAYRPVSDAEARQLAAASIVVARHLRSAA